MFIEPEPTVNGSGRKDKALRAGETAGALSSLVHLASFSQPDGFSRP
jgi:hypothetical protein